MEALVDNDILFKAVCYDLLDELLSQNFSSTNLLGILGAARFVVSKNILKRLPEADSETAVDKLFTFIENVAIVEPTADEQTMAADFELAAQQTGVALDAGESQLCAIIISRAVPQLLTGDKRAIHAIEKLLDVDTRLRSLCSRVKCLEQLVLQSISENNASQFRISICSVPDADKTLSICFSCRSQNTTLEEVTNGLNSYIEDIRRRAPQILAAN